MSVFARLQFNSLQTTIPHVAALDDVGRELTNSQCSRQFKKCGVDDHDLVCTNCSQGTLVAVASEAQLVKGICSQGTSRRTALIMQVKYLPNRLAPYCKQYSRRI
jgi:hypothetical protein